MKKNILLLWMVTISTIAVAQKISPKECASRLLSEEDVHGLSADELNLIRNGIYAANCYVFTNESLDRFFYGRYKQVEDNSKIVLSRIEEKNVVFLKEKEDAERRKRSTSIADLKRLKLALNNGNRSIVDGIFINLSNFEYYEPLLLDLKKTLNYMNLDEINWNRSRGLYKVTIDNGYSICEYYILFEGDDITIKNGIDNHTEIFGDFYDGYSDYMSEGEYQVWWRFRMTDSGDQCKNLRSKYNVFIFAVKRYDGYFRL